MAIPSTRKKSAAYEAGMREGRADKSKAPKVEIEISAPEEEEEEGPEGEEMDSTSGKAKPSRKRSAKGAKNTKAPMDAECGCGGAKKGSKCSCDGGCGQAMKGRNDALTPQEYLAACDLGIQGRSRPYIRSRLDTAMALTPASIRADLKCGKGSISPGEKCSKGQAQQITQRKTTQGQFSAIANNAKTARKFSEAKASTAGVGRKIMRAGEFAANAGQAASIGLGIAGSIQGALRGNMAQMQHGTATIRAGMAAGRLAQASKARRMGDKKLANEFLKSAGRQAAAAGVSGALAVGFSRTSNPYINNSGRPLRTMSNEAYKAEQRRTASRRGRRDSVYADGFAPDLDQLAI